MDDACPACATGIGTSERSRRKQSPHLYTSLRGHKGHGNPQHAAWGSRGPFGARNDNEQRTQYATTTGWICRITALDVIKNTLVLAYRW